MQGRRAAKTRRIVAARLSGRALCEFLRRLPVRFLHEFERDDPTRKELQLYDSLPKNEKIIYLSDFGEHIMIVPVVRYAEVEIPIRTRRQVHVLEKKGKEFSLDRNKDEEQSFMVALLQQHPFFEEQLENDLYYFYLHKKRFLAEEWFLETFEKWRQENITVLGFNELKISSLRLVSTPSWRMSIMSIFGM